MAHAQWWEHLAPHPCGPGSNSGVDAICGLSLLFIVSLAPRGFLRVLRFSPLLKYQHFQIPNRYGTNAHVSTRSQELLSAPWVNSRGTQRRFPPKYIENTFQAIQSTLKSLEMYSNRRYKICTSSVILGELFEITRASVLFSRKFQMQFNVLWKWEFFWFLPPAHFWIQKF